LSRKRGGYVRPAGGETTCSGGEAIRGPASYTRRLPLRKIKAETRRGARENESGRKKSTRAPGVRLENSKIQKEKPAGREIGGGRCRQGGDEKNKGRPKRRGREGGLRAEIPGHLFGVFA